MKKLSKKIVLLLKKKKLKLSIAESCTGGLLSSAITSVSGSSKIFTMGLVTYSNKSKNLLIKVPLKTIKTLKVNLSRVEGESRLSKQIN